MSYQCQRCGKPFGGRKRKYCCEQCAAGAKKARDRLRQKTFKPRRNPTPIVNGMRECLHCREAKALATFVTSKASKSGYLSTCRQCDQARRQCRSKRQAADRAIIKRQECNTHYCDLSQASAYRFMASLLNEDGSLNKEDQVGYYSAIRRLSSGDVDREIRARIRRKRLESEILRQREASRKKARKLRIIKAGNHRSKMEAARALDAEGLPTETINRNLYQRMRGHVRKHQRRGRVAVLPPSSWIYSESSFRTTFGYSPDELRIHLERQFGKSMTWGKFIAGLIHIDHVIPASRFDLADRKEFGVCYSLPNLQPMFARQNISKRDKRLTLL